MQLRPPFLKTRFNSGRLSGFFGSWRRTRSCRRAYARSRTRFAFFDEMTRLAVSRLGRRLGRSFWSRKLKPSRDVRAVALPATLRGSAELSRTVLTTFFSRNFGILTSCERRHYEHFLYLLSCSYCILDNLPRRTKYFVQLNRVASDLNRTPICAVGLPPQAFADRYGTEFLDPRLGLLLARNIGG